MRADAFADGHVELLQLILSEQSPLAGKTLMELPVLTRSNVLIGAVERGGSMVTIPGGSFRLEIDGDLFKAIVSFPQDGTQELHA